VPGVSFDGVPAGALARRWHVPQCRVVGRVTSTLDMIHALGGRQGGAPPGTVVLAQEQTTGRGRDGRVWHSPPGGIWLAVLLRPSRAVLSIASIRAGLVLADAVDELLGEPRTRLKWPNDVLLDGRKLAGILCEGRWQGDALQWLAIGIGVNVENEIPAALGGTAIALREVLPHVRRLDLLDRMVPPLPGLLAHGTRLTQAECDAFAARDWLRDRWLRHPVAGRAAGLRPDGALLVETAAASTAVREGHVELA
jgi:BirA family biotin operon repressor/biotin-[acetyl-CoA-carboxylase] ligase